MHPKECGTTFLSHNYSIILTWQAQPIIEFFFLQ
jgi:hypothetical protein